jgi:hypothetical protein
MKAIKILIVVATSILTSCSAEWHLKKAIKKGIELQKDSISVLDTVIINEVFHDTTVVTKRNDTVFINKDQWHVKIVRINDTLQVQGGCSGDTIYIEKKVPIDRVINKVDYLSGINKLIKWLFLLVLSIIICFVIFKKL